MPARLVPVEDYPRVERLYRSGLTLAQIGALYKVSRERIRQLLKPRGIVGKHGGAATLAARAEANRRAALDAKYLKRHGCTFDQYRSVCPYGGYTKSERYRTPMGAFILQRNNARSRGIPWNFKFWEWWTIWQNSGHWAERGRGHGYVMARHNDQGGYEPGNVKIILANENVAEYYERERAIHGRVRSGTERKAA